jgi:hypothetical protein
MQLAMVVALALGVAGEDELVTVAKAVELRSKVDEVQAATASLGKPRSTTYRWCNSAGCTKQDEETGATQMQVRWTRGRTSLVVLFCRSWHAIPWQVVQVDAWRLVGKDAWDREKPPEVLFKAEYEQASSFCFARNE